MASSLVIGVFDIVLCKPGGAIIWATLAAGLLTALVAPEVATLLAEILVFANFGVFAVGLALPNLIFILG